MRWCQRCSCTKLVSACILDIISEQNIILWSEMKSDKQEALALSIGSSVASMIGKVVTHPIDTIKSKVQVNRLQMKKITDVKFGTAKKLAIKTYQNEGIKGFFRGVTISVFGSMIAFSCYMSSYEYSKKVLGRYQLFKDHPTLSHLLSGLVAEVISCSVWLPIDVIKERLQVQSELNIYKYSGPRDAARKINLSEGITGLYRAYGATLLFFGPFSAIFFASFEKMKDLVTKDREKPTLTESIISSATASAFAGFITTPLEVVKLRMQVQRADVATHGGSLQKSIFGYRNAFHGLYKMYKTEGFFALFKGGLMRICFTIPITTICMSLTELFKQQLLRSHVLEPLI